jgi:tRNA A-37 threonylcarbamoyl transferase component Bud32
MIESSRRIFVMLQVDGDLGVLMLSEVEMDKCIESDRYREADISNAIKKAVASLWEAGVVHNDIAARHVLVQSPDRVFILDFGLSQVLSSIHQKHLLRDIADLQHLVTSSVHDWLESSLRGLRRISHSRERLSMYI